MKSIILLFLMWIISGSYLSGQKSVSSVIAQGYVNGSCNDLYMSATISQTITGASDCGPYSVLMGFQQPIGQSTTPIYQQVLKNLHLFPNPTAGNLTLSGTLVTPGKSIHIKIIDLLGKVVFEHKVTNYTNYSELDVRTLHPGLYSLVITKSNTELQTILFIKQ